MLLLIVSVSLLYAPTAESSFTLLGSLVTSLTLLVLIWERLREFAVRKLEFLNRRALSPVLKITQSTFGFYYGQSETFHKTSKLLRRRGRYLRIMLYPKGIVASLERAAEAMESYQKYEKEFADQFAPNFLIRNLLIALDLLPRSNESIQEIEKYKEMLSSLKQKGKAFLEVCQNLEELLEGIRKEIVDFFEANELEFVEETSLTAYSRATY